ncbi:MAG: PAS domain S-box protein [Opitutaceae bacterium]|nr:PAS domain S-box protein [Opitutaceae bacterium]
MPPAKSPGGYAAAPPGPAEPAQRDAAEAAEESYRVLFRSNPLPMWVFDRENFRFLAVNEAAVRHYGYSEQEFLQLRVTDIRSAADVPEFLAAIATETPATYTGCTHHRKKDGTVIEVEITSHRIKFEGRPGRLVLARDITAEKAAQEKLREQAALLHRAPDGIVVRDLGHVIHFWNHGAERLYGWSAAEADGRRVDELLQIDATAFRTAVEVLRATGEWAGEFAVITR